MDLADRGASVVRLMVPCMAVLAEATRRAANAGIDAGRLPEALAGWFCRLHSAVFVPRMVQGIHSPPLGHIAIMLKDLDTVIEDRGGARHVQPGADGIARCTVVQCSQILAGRRCRRARNFTNYPPHNRTEVRLKIIVVMEELICGRDRHG